MPFLYPDINLEWHDRKIKKLNTSRKKVGNRENCILKSNYLKRNLCH